MKTSELETDAMARLAASDFSASVLDMCCGSRMFWFDRKNPRGAADIAHLPPEELVASILHKEQRIAELMGNIRDLLAKHSA